jgi:glycosyltransferase involved in cell wall biosynthesis
MHSSGDSPLVSAIIPAYNCAAYIGSSVKSVLTQTYPRVECIVVDDGSTDGTGSLIEEEFGPSVTLIRQSNRGVSAARNAGAKAARGAYLAFLDADDLWLPEKIEKQVALFEKAPSVAYVYSAFFFVDEDLTVTGVGEIPPPQDALRNAATLTSPSINLAQTGMVRSAVFQELGGFDETLSTSADLDFVLRATTAFESKGLPEPVAMYRHSESQMSQDPALMESDMKRVLEKFYGSPRGSEFRHLKRRAYANLHSVLAAMYLRRGEYAGGARALAIALLQDPRVVMRKLPRSLGKLLRMARSGVLT